MKRAPIILLALGLVFFGAALVHLFQLRFAAGDIYPAYSTMRTDPLGAKAFHDSVEQLLQVRRNFRPLSKLGDGRETTLFYLGAERHELDLAPGELKALNSFMKSGGRLVISLYPSFQSSRYTAASSSSTNRTAAGRKPKNQPSARKEAEPAPTKFLGEEWGFETQYRLLPKSENGQRESAAALLSETHSGSGLPEIISCHSAIVFTTLEDPWRVIYTRSNEGPVVIERDIGDGTLVMAADSYLVSNEGLWRERHSGFLSWLIGDSTTAMFDETHLGVHESSGVASLLRKYKLHGCFAALLVVVGLFIWKNATSLVPPAEDAEATTAGSVEGKEAAAGFINLLRRNIPSSQVLGVCFTEWQKSCSRSHSPPRVTQVQDIVDRENQRPARERDQVGIYREISRTLSRKNK